MRHAALILSLALAACSGAPEKAPKNEAPDLETAAIERGLVPDPASKDPTGLYARETDRLCIVENRIGVSVDYDDANACGGAGTFQRAGDKLDVTLGDGCGFEAAIDGERVVFPGRVPNGCARLCKGRASFAGLRVERLSEAAAEARALRSPNGKLLCAGGSAAR